MDCFVIPSRGEGWGRPHIEAMSMGLPVIATNWSGNLEFMKPWNSYLIKVDDLIEIPSGPFAGHKWANPSILHLQSLMREVFTHPEKAKARGSVAEIYIRKNYSPEAISSIILKHIDRISSCTLPKN